MQLGSTRKSIIRISDSRGRQTEDVTAELIQFANNRLSFQGSSSEAGAACVFGDNGPETLGRLRSSGKTEAVTPAWGG